MFSLKVIFHRVAPDNSEQDTAGKTSRQVVLALVLVPATS